MKNTIGKTATTIREEGVTMIVRYHETDVFSFDRLTRQVTLDTGGWIRPTTKRRMNQSGAFFGLNFSVCQRNKKFVVTHDGISDVFTKKIQFFV